MFDLSPVRTLSDYARDGLRMAEATGSYRMSEATRIAMDMFVKDHGMVTPMQYDLMSDGMRTYVKAVRPPRDPALPSDAELRARFKDDPFITLEWAATYVAWEETADACRKPVLDLNLHEAEQVVRYRRRKARQMDRLTDHIDEAIDRYAIWRDNPALTMGQVIALALAQDRPEGA